MKNLWNRWFTHWILPSHRLHQWALALSVLPLLLCLSAALPSRLAAQSPGRFELGGDYNFVHTNAPPGECGCFSMNGGDAWVGWHITDHFSAVAQGAVQHASRINGTTADLTLVSFLAGPRVTFRETHRWLPFAQALFGGAHASGLLTPSPTTGASGAANAFAFTAGGGLDFNLKMNFAIRAIEVDYFHTRFDNGVNQHQNNLRVAAGLFFRF
jgi:outer membrane immunogenic protein